MNNVNNPSNVSQKTSFETEPTKDAEQILTDIKDEVSALNASIASGRVIHIQDFASGDGTDQTAEMTAFFDSANDGDTLLFSPGHYKVSKAGWFYQFTSKKSMTLKGVSGAVFEVSDQGLRFEDCDGLTIDGLTLVRTSQAAWSKAITGIFVKTSSNVTIKNNDISKFTDAISVNGADNSLVFPCKNIHIKNNRLHDLGEEPIVVRTNTINVVIEENECFRYLGDGILLKGTWNCFIERNFLHTPITSNDSDYLTFSNGNAAGGLVPYRGGGITCNNESGETGSVGLRVANNTLIHTSYGVGLLGFYGARIESNHFKNVGHVTSVISVSLFPSVYNPNMVTNHLFIIANNHIETVAKTTGTAAIEARTTIGIVGMDFGIIANNIVNVNGKHYGIQAEGNISVTGNYIGNAGIGMVLKNGVVATGNIINGAFDSVSPDTHVVIYDDVTFSNNSITGKGTALKLRGTKSVITGNRVKYQGGWWAIHFDIASFTVEENILRDNIVAIAGPGAGKYLYGSSSVSTKKNIVVETEMYNDVFNYTLQDIIVKSSDNKRWKLVVGTDGTLSATQV